MRIRGLAGMVAMIAGGMWITEDAKGGLITVDCDVTDLAEAITAANNAAGPDRIELAANCTYTFTAANNSDPFDGDNALPIVTDELIIDGNGATLTRGNGAPAFRFIRSTAALGLENVTLSNGLLDVDDTARGGAVRAQSTFSSDGVAFDGNRATADYAYGGAVFASGVATLIDTTFADNVAESTFGGSQGGGINAFAGLSITTSTFTNNGAHSGTGTSNGGGAFSTSVVTVVSSTFTGNSVTGSGGGGGAISTIDAVTVTASRFQENSVDVTGSTGNGGAIQTNGTVSATTSTFDRNSVIAFDSARGGASYAGDDTTIVRSLFVQNSATSTGQAAEGGGAFTLGELVVENSTFSGNDVNGVLATFVSAGGGTFAVQPATISNATYLGNTVTGFSARGHAAGLVNGGNIRNSILAAPGATTACWAFNSSEIDAGGDSLASDASCDQADVFTVANMFIDPLGDNGGPTWTHGLDELSPAIGNGTSCLPLDQRGYQRTGSCDSGAFELNAVAPPPSILDVDCDLDEDLFDALAVMNVLAGITTGPQPQSPCTADVDNVGGLTLADVIAIRRAVAGLPN